MAIKSRATPNLNEYYCDLQFSPGREECNFFFDLPPVLPSTASSPQIPEAEWPRLDMLIHLTTKYLHISDIFIFNHDEASRKKAAHLKALNAKCLKVRGLLAEALKENKVRTAICQQLLVSLKKILDGTEETKVTNKAVIPLKTLRKILPSQSNLKSTWEAVCEMIVACDSFLANDLGNLTVTASLEYLDKFRNEVSEKEKICISKLKSDEERLCRRVFSVN